MLSFAKDIGININTHGAENWPLPKAEYTFKYGQYKPSKTKGEFFANLRQDAGLKQKDLCEGICNPQVLGRLERDESECSVYYQEAIMQRLGRDSSRYFATFLDMEIFRGKQLRDKVRALFTKVSKAEGEMYLQELKAHKDFKSGINLQFIKMEEAMVHLDRNGFDQAHINMLEEAWKITKHTIDIFDSHRIAKTPLTEYELMLVYKLAQHLYCTGDYRGGLRLLEGIMTSMASFYVDETAIAHLQVAVLDEYARQLDSMGRWDDACKYAMEGLGIAFKYNNLSPLPGLLSTLGCAYFSKGEMAQSQSYLVASYHIAGMLEQTNMQQRIGEYIHKNFRKTLSHIF